MIPGNPDVVQVSFLKPFVYAPLSDQVPSSVVNENFGYVPRSLIEWMAQDSVYVSKFPDIASCLPGGPSIDFFGSFCPYSQNPAPDSLLQVQLREPDLTIKTTITVAGKGCFHPGACPASATPAAIAVVATPVVTPEAEPLRQAGASSAAQAQSRMSNMSDLQQENYIC